MCVSPSLSSLHGVICECTRTGMMSAMALTAMLLPVPRSPNRITPPTAGSTAFTRRARRIDSCPSMHTNGNGGLRRYTSSSSSLLALAAVGSACVDETFAAAYTERADIMKRRASPQQRRCCTIRSCCRGERIACMTVFIYNVFLLIPCRLFPPLSLSFSLSLSLSLSFSLSLRLPPSSCIACTEWISRR